MSNPQGDCPRAPRHSVEEVWNWLLAHPLPQRVEKVPLEKAHGRVLAIDVISPVNVPQFVRAMMDGYAVHANDTRGAHSNSPVPLTVKGCSLPGRPWNVDQAFLHETTGCPLPRGGAVRVMTGAPMPGGADAVVPVELADEAGNENRVLIKAEMESGRNVGPVGEDILANETVLTKGRRLRPQDVGLLSSLGIANIEVFAPVRVTLIVTGNELLPAGTTPAGFKIADSNGPMLQGLVTRDGGTVIRSAILADDANLILRHLRENTDLVLLSGGSSAGDEDHAPRLLRQFGDLSIHGVALRPGGPAGLGTLEGHLVALLPGNPVACLCAYDLFAGRALRRATGMPNWPYRRVQIPLANDIVSSIGRVDYARVIIEGGGVQWIGKSGASRLSSTTRSTGFVIVPADRPVLEKGEKVDVFFYD